MAIVLVDNQQVEFLSISEISDSLSPTGQSFSIEGLGNPVTNKQGGVLVQILDDDGDILAIGNITSITVKIGIRPRTTYTAIDLTRKLQGKPITGDFNGSIVSVLNLLLTRSEISAYFLGIRFLCSTEAQSAIIKVSYKAQFFKDILPNILSLSGFPLQYRVPIDEKIIEIFEIGYTVLAPVPRVNVADLYGSAQVGLKGVNYQEIGVIASVFQCFGRKGEFASLDDPTANNKNEYLRYRAQDGRTSYPLLESADKVLSILVTTRANASCLLAAWTPTGIVRQINQSTYNPPINATGQGFYLTKDDVSPSATGDFTANIEIPDVGYSIRLLFFSNFEYDASESPPVNYGSIYLYLNGSFQLNFDIGGHYNGGISSSLFFGELSFLSLDSYVGTTVEFSLKYNNSNYTALFPPFAGELLVFPIRVCHSPQQYLNGTSGFGSAQILVSTTVSSSSTYDYSTTYNLKNYFNDMPEFFALVCIFGDYTLPAGISGNSVEVVINGVSVNLSTVVSTNYQQYFVLYIDNNLAGENIPIELHVTTNSITASSVSMFLVFA